MIECRDTMLTEEQRQLVADNHKLIYLYATRNELDVDEWYDVLAIGLCKAAVGYDKSTGYTFTTYAMHGLRLAHIQTIRTNNAASRNPSEPLVSLSEPIAVDRGEDFTYEEVIADDENLFEYVDMLLTIQDFQSKLNLREKMALYCLYKGYDVTETAKILHSTPGAIRTLKFKLKQKWKNYYHNSI